MTRIFLGRAGRTALLNGAILALLSFGALRFGYHIQWMFYVLLVLGVFECWSVPQELRHQARMIRCAQYLGFLVVALPFGIAILNLFGIVGMKEIAIASGTTLLLGLALWGSSLLAPER